MAAAGGLSHLNNKKVITTLVAISWSIRAHTKHYKYIRVSQGCLFFALPLACLGCLACCLLSGRKASPSWLPSTHIHSQIFSQPFYIFIFVAEILIYCYSLVCAVYTSPIEWVCASNWASLAQRQQQVRKWSSRIKDQWETIRKHWQKKSIFQKCETALKSDLLFFCFQFGGSFLFDFLW